VSLLLGVLHTWLLPGGESRPFQASLVLEVLSEVLHWVFVLQTLCPVVWHMLLAKERLEMSDRVVHLLSVYIQKHWCGIGDNSTFRPIPSLGKDEEGRQSGRVTTLLQQHGCSSTVLIPTKGGCNSFIREKQSSLYIHIRLQPLVR
jgi:hypothetical protein